MSKLHIRPCTLRDANTFVTNYHRHHKPTVGHKFSIACYDGDRLVGVAICGLEKEVVETTVCHMKRKSDMRNILNNGV